MIVMMAYLCVQPVLTDYTASSVRCADIVKQTRRVTRSQDIVQADVRPVIAHRFATPVSVV